MQETFIVSVMTVDGRLLIQKRIMPDYYASLSILARLLDLLSQVCEDTGQLKTMLGSGIQLSASPSPFSTES